jgi:ABC-type Mn2+/Zn2+ transport system ATPase subunit
MIELANIDIKYEGRTVFAVEHLRFEAGKCYALLGANGSGKTTLLRTIVGNIAPGSGSVAFRSDLRTDDIGYMPQKPYAFGFSVWRNVAMALPRGMDKRHAKERAYSALGQMGMEGFAEQRGNRLSGGEQQRMAFARMIVRERRLLLLDEPTSATDIAGNDMVEEALKRYRESTGCTIIFASHSLPQAMRIADEALLLDDGLIIESGPVSRVILQPESERGKAFLQHWRV